VNKLLIAVGILIGVIIAAIAAIPYVVDFNDYKDEISDRIARATGRPFDISGDLRLEILPTPRLRASDVTLANLPGAENPAMVAIASLDVTVALGPLLGGEVRVERITLVKPEVEFLVTRSGRQNWDFLEAMLASEPGGAAIDDTAIRLDDVGIRDGILRYRDERSGFVESLTGIDGRFSADDLHGPYSLLVEAALDGRQVAVDAVVGPVGGGRFGGIKVTIRLTEIDAEIKLTGSLTGTAAGTAVKGKLEAKGANAGGILALAAGIGNDTAPTFPALRGPMAVRAAVALSGRQLALSDIDLRIGGTAGTGAVAVTLAERPNVDARFSFSRIDLADWRSSLSGGGSGPARFGMPDGSTLRAFWPTWLPPDLTGVLEVDVGAISFGDGSVRRLAFGAQIADGELVLSRASARLPGGSDVRLSGRAVPQDGHLRFDGALTATSDNLRALIASAGGDLTAVPADRLRRLDLTATVSLTPELVQIYGIDLAIDASRLTGGIAYALRQRPSFGLDLAVDRLNFDAYVVETGVRPTDQPSGATPGAEQASFRGWPLLGRFDTNAKLRVGKLTIAGVAVNELELDASLIAGKISLRRARAASLAGLSLVASGTAAQIATSPTFDLDLQFGASDLTTLSRTFALALPIAPARLKDLNLRGHLFGSLGRPELQLAGAVAGLQLKGTGYVGLASDPRTISLRMAAAADRTRPLARLFDLPFNPRAEADGPLQLNLALDGSLSTMDMVLDGTLAGGTVTVEGQVRPFDDAERFDLRVGLDHPDLVDFAGLLGADYVPRAANIGGVNLSAVVRRQADEIRADDVLAQIGPADLAGKVALSLTGERPMLSAELRSNEVIADLFLPIDLDLPRSIDMDVVLTAPALEYAGLQFESPRLQARVADGILTLAPMTARLFDGDLEATLARSLDPRPRYELDITLRQADLGQASMAITGAGRVQGRFDFDGDFNATGDNPARLVENLNGGANFTVRGGRLLGADLALLGERLANDTGAADVDKALDAVLGEGQSGLQQATGSWVVESGVARTTDMKVDFDATRVGVEGAIDLAHWSMDLRTTLTWPEQAALPALGVGFKGPIGASERRIRARALQAFLADRATPEPAASESSPQVPNTDQAVGAPTAGDDVITDPPPTRVPH